MRPVPLTELWSALAAAGGVPGVDARFGWLVAAALLAGTTVGLLGCVWLRSLRARERALEGRVQQRTAALYAALEHSAQSEASFRTLADRLPVAVTILVDGKLAYGNDEALRLTGRSSLDDYLKAPLETWVHPADQALLFDQAAQVARGEPCAPRELRLCGAEGGTRIVESFGVPTIFGGRPASLLIARDVTERREMEERLKLSERLAAVGTLSAGVAHEINNPLAFMLSNLNYASEELEGIDARLASGDAQAARHLVGEIAEAVLEARDGGLRVQRIVRDLKASTHAGQDSEVTHDLRAVVESTLNLCRTEVRKRAHLVSELEDSPPVVMNPSRLGQVLLNLITNAAQAIPEGAPQHHQVTVKTCRGDDRHVCVEVRDTGAGISPEVLPRLFDPFFTTKPVGVGTGLGLSICHGFVAASGGQLEVQSEVGKGTVFRLLLRRAPEAQDHRAISAPAKQFE